MTHWLEPGVQFAQVERPRLVRRFWRSSWDGRIEASSGFVVSHPFRKRREMDGARGVDGAPTDFWPSGKRLAWERSSSSSDVPGGAGWGWLQSITSPVGGWSRQEPTG